MSSGIRPPAHAVAHHLPRITACLAAFSAAAWAPPALAQATPAPAAATAATAATPANDSVDANIWTRSNLLGTIGGLRTVLGNYGISLGLTEVSEVLGNATGGINQGAAYEGLTTMSLGLDTAKAFGWAGGTFNVSALQIHGRNLSTDNLESLQTASGIEAQRATRLWELWYQQSFLDGAFDIKVGQQSIDQEFMVSQYSGLFINTMMGWPMLPSDDLYAGGPAYPLSSLGVRGRAVLGSFTLLGGVFDDNPPGGPFDDDSQVRGAEQSGTKFNTGTGALFIAELQYAINQPAPGDIDTGAAAGLPGTYKLGAWVRQRRVPGPALRHDGPVAGRSAELRQSADAPRQLQHLRRRRPDGLAAGIGQHAFAWRLRPASWAPPATANLIDFSVNAGVSLKAPLPGRDNDTAGLGFGVAHVSGNAASLDGDTAFFTQTAIPKRGTETFLEATYQYTVAPWWVRAAGLPVHLQHRRRAAESQHRQAHRRRGRVRPADEHHLLKGCA